LNNWAKDAYESVSSQSPKLSLREGNFTLIGGFIHFIRRQSQTLSNQGTESHGFPGKVRHRGGRFRLSFEPQIKAKALKTGKMGCGKAFC